MPYMLEYKFTHRWLYHLQMGDYKILGLYVKHKNKFDFKVAKTCDKKLAVVCGRYSMSLQNT